MKTFPNDNRVLVFTDNLNLANATQKRFDSGVWWCTRDLSYVRIRFKKHLLPHGNGPIVSEKFNGVWLVDLHSTGGNIILEISSLRDFLYAAIVIILRMKIRLQGWLRFKTFLQPQQNNLCYLNTLVALKCYLDKNLIMMRCSVILGTSISLMLIATELMTRKINGQCRLKLVQPTE